MSSQERSAVVSFITSSLVFIGFSIYLWGLYRSGGLDGPDASAVVGKSVLWLVGISIALSIVAQILGTIIHAIVTREEPVMVSDERDKLIELKGMQATLVLFSIGYLGAMAALAFEVAPYQVFLIIISSMFIASIIGDLTRLIIYRLGF